MQKKLGFILIPFFLIFSLLLSCEPNITSLKGTYISQDIKDKVIQISVDKSKKSFVQYINQRKVDEGTFKEKANNLYIFESELQSFEITLTKENEFDIFIEKVDDKNNIKLKNSSDIPVYYSTNFEDEKEYIKLIK